MTQEQQQEYPYGFLEGECQITSSQEDILSRCPFAGQEKDEKHLPTSSSSPAATVNDWPDISTSSSPDLEMTQKNVTNITMVSLSSSDSETGDTLRLNDDVFRTPPEGVGTTMTTSVSSYDDAVQTPAAKRKRVKGVSQERECDATQILTQTQVIEIETEEMEDYCSEGERGMEKGGQGGNLVGGGKDENLMKYVMEALKIIAAKEEGLRGQFGGNVGGGGETVDVFETVKRKGVIFPRNRHYGED